MNPDDHHVPCDDAVDAAELTRRDISLLNVAVAAAQNRRAELRTELALALANGVAPQELVTILDSAASRTDHEVNDHISLLCDILRDADGQ